MLRLTIFILSLTMFLSCEEDVTIKIEDNDRQIVINSIISTDSIWNVNLTYSKSIFSDQEFEYIQAASVKVTNLTNDQSFFLKSIGNGDYQRALMPNEGHSYELEINTDEGESARAVTYVPSVLKVEVMRSNSIDENGNNTIEIDIEIEDNPVEENFYVWEIVENKIVEEEIVTEPLNIDFTLPTEFEEGQTELKSLNSLLFISDDKFNGKKYSTKLTLGNDVINNGEGGNDNASSSETPRFNLRIMAVSKDLYEYLRTYELYKQTDIAITSINQPVNVYSNIENGLGIFGGYNLKEFPIE
ncbi:MAG: DUF4249 domain-containing protein [Saprospiraceae bacterium]|nr:DUF4249 domain-containing protein [Saprospiraceae bacterium]